MSLRLFSFLLSFLVLAGVARADDDEPSGGGDEPAAAEPAEPAEPAAQPEPEPEPEPEPAAAGAADDDKPGDDGTPDDDAKGDDGTPDGDGTPDAPNDDDHTPDAAATSDDDDGDGDIDTTDPFDADGDGIVADDERADAAAFQAEFADIPDDVDAAALDARPESAELVPSLTAEKFRSLVALAKKVVLDKMAAKIAAKADARMRTLSWALFGLSCAGFLLLAMPLVLRKRYPGRGTILAKYSALAAVTFFVTVNLFGGVMFGMRTAQGELSRYTNPSVAVATGTFDTLARNADDYLVLGKELFAPTLEQMNKHPDEQPAALLLDNAAKLLGDAKVFLRIKAMVGQVDFVFSILPIVLLCVTLVLFLLALRPTLTEIVKLPIAAAWSDGSGSLGTDVVKASMRRVRGEMLATLGTVAVLSVLTIVSAVVLGKIVGPALDAFLGYFSVAVQYLQFVEGASTALVFLALFGVILFLVLNLGTLIASMSMFLGKCQKAFQARFNDGVPLATHRRLWTRGTLAVLLVQLFPLAFVYVAGWGLAKINDSILAGVADAESVSWSKLMLAGPLFLVVAFAVLFWAVRGVAAIKLLATYKVTRPGSPVAAARG